MGRPVSYEVPNFNGCYHSLDGTTPDPSLLWFSENMWPTDPANPSSLRVRPGLTQGPYIAAIGASPQGLFTLPSSTTGLDKVFAVISGEIYQGTAVGAGGWTKRISTANLTAASITLTATGIVYGVVYGGTLLFSDGTNTPFTWDGTAGGGLTSLTNAPVFSGVPTVYYAKVFAILNSDPLSIVWSEENAANTGYTAGGYNNKWKLSQTSQNPLLSIVASNEALYYFRSMGIGRITGAVTPDFTTTGTHDAISDTIGAGESPIQPLAAGGNVYFVDYTWRPRIIQGTQLRDLSTSLPAFLTTTKPASFPVPAYEASTLGTISGQRWDPTTSWVYYATPTIYSGYLFYWYWSADNASTIALVFHYDTLRFLGYFTFPLQAAGTAQTMVLANQPWGVTLTAAGPLLLLMDQNSGARQVTVSAFNLHNPVLTNGVTDTVGATTTQITPRFITGKLGISRDTQQFFEAITAETWIDNSNAVMNVQYLTSQQPEIEDMAAVQAVTPSVRARESKSVGIQGYGRWIALVGTVTLSGSSMAEWLGLKVTGFVDAPELANV